MTMGEQPEFQHEIDARGLRCPEPVMMLHARIRRMAAGDVVRLVATDPSTTRDVVKFCDHLGHALLAQSVDGDDFVFYVRRKA